MKFRRPLHKLRWTQSGSLSLWADENRRIRLQFQVTNKLTRQTQLSLAWLRNRTRNQSTLSNVNNYSVIKIHQQLKLDLLNQARRKEALRRCLHEPEPVKPLWCRVDAQSQQRLRSRATLRNTFGARTNKKFIVPSAWAKRQVLERRSLVSISVRLEINQTSAVCFAGFVEDKLIRPKWK